MSYPYFPPSTQTVEGVLYHLDRWHYSDDYNTVQAQYYIDFDYEQTSYDPVIYRTFEAD